MGNKLALCVAALAGALIAVLGVSVFRHIIEADSAYIINNKTLVSIVGVLGLLFFSKVVHDARLSAPRFYGVFLLGVACAIFLQATIYFKASCSDDCGTDFLMKIAVCVIMMVDGFSGYHRKSA